MRNGDALAYAGGAETLALHDGFMNLAGFQAQRGGHRTRHFGQDLLATLPAGAGDNGGRKKEIAQAGDNHRAGHAATSPGRTDRTVITLLSPSRGDAPM